MKHKEHQEQRKLIIWASREAKNIPELGMLFAIPNAGKRTFRQASWMLAEGIKAGVPDLFLAIPKNQHHGLFIEMKSEKGNPTEKQNKWHKKLRLHDYKVLVCKNFEQAQSEILEYLDMK